MKLAWLGRNRNWMLVGAALLLAIAALLPPIEARQKVFDHLVVFDVTQSMNVADQSIAGATQSRLAYAKQTLLDAISTLPCGSRVGLGLFANRRTLLVLSPVDVCANHAELRHAIQQIDSRMAWEHASVIARGLYTAIDVAAELAPSPSLVFVTDGHAAPPVDDRDIPAFEKPATRIYGTIWGVGGLTPQPIPRTNREGQSIGWWTADAVVQRQDGTTQEHYSALHETHLQALATATGLDYSRLDSARAAQTSLSRSELARELVVPADFRWIPALAAFLLLMSFYLFAIRPKKRAARNTTTMPTAVSPFRSAPPAPQTGVSQSKPIAARTSGS